MERKKSMEKQTTLIIEEKKRQDYILDKEIELKSQISLIKGDLLISILFIILITYIMKIHVSKGGNVILSMVVLIIEILDFTKNISNLVHKEAKSGLRVRIILKYILRFLLAVFILKPLLYTKTIAYSVISLIGIIIAVIDDGK
jgi:hypothetical protein